MNNHTSMMDEKALISKSPPTLEDIYDLIRSTCVASSSSTETCKLNGENEGDGGAVLTEQDDTYSMDLGPDVVSQILNVYLFGSRLYQCHSEDSDYDFICIVGGKYFDGSKLIDNGIFNVNVYHWDYWLHLMHENMIWAVMVLFMPSDMIWKQTRDLKSHFSLDGYRLRNACLQDASHNWAKAKRLCTHASLRSEKVAKKNIVHGFRYLNLTLQVLQTGEIYDFTQGNDIWEELFVADTNTQYSTFIEQWQCYESRYKVKFQDLMSTVKHFAHVQESLETEEISTSKNAKKRKAMSPYMSSPTKKLHVMDYISKHTLNSLKRDFSIEVTRPYSTIGYPELVVCTLSNEFTPRWTCPSPVSRECTTIVLVEKGEGYSVLASSSLPIFDKFDEDTGIDNDFMSDLVNIDWDHIALSERIDGIPFLLFWYMDRWLVYTPTINSSKYKQYTHVHIVQYKRIFQGTEEDALNQLTKAFWETWNQSNYVLPEVGLEQISYTFQLCLSLEHDLDCYGGRAFISDGHTVQHSQNKLICSSMIQVDSINQLVTELPIENITERYNWETPQRLDHILEGYSIGADVLGAERILRSYVRKLNPMYSIGVVVTDQFMNRVQYVTPQYYALDQLQIADLVEPNTNSRNVEIIARTNDYCSFLEYYPWNNQEVLKELYNKYHATVVTFCSFIQDLYDENRKKYEHDVKNWISFGRQFTFYYVLFDMQKLGITAREFYSSINPRKVSKAVRDVQDYLESVKSKDDNSEM